MHLLDGQLILSPTDLVGYLACEHLTQLELAASRGEITRPNRDDPELDLLVRKGQAHEADHLATLTAEHGMVVEIGDHGGSAEALYAAEAETLAAMRQGADVIYQAGFFDGRWRGRADFLLRVETPSDLGAWSYEVADTKLARRVKVTALLQMCEYSLHVARLQGRPPVNMHVVLGDKSTESHLVADFDAYHRAARRRLETTVLGDSLTTYPDPVDHCGVCRWIDRCKDQRRADDHLSLVAGMRRDQTRRLTDAGIATVASLAAASEAPVADVGDVAWERLRRQAGLQMEERTTGKAVYELLPFEAPDRGIAALPRPSRGDLFFDMEGDPFAEEGGLEYLFGITEIVDGTPAFHAFWAHDRTAEKVAFEALVDFVIGRLDSDPDMHVYHYAAYEETALKKLMGRHSTREDEVDRILRGDVLVDLYRVVRQGVRVSCESYSLKSLETFYMARREEAIVGAGASIVAYEQWKESQDETQLEAIRAYNERDCESTRLLRGWLERLREELGGIIGHEVPRPEPRSGAPPESVVQASAETEQLVEALTAAEAVGAGESGEAQPARLLLAQLLDYHRREDKSSWWAYYARLEMTDDELVEDAEAIGSIIHLGAVGADKRSIVHEYGFDLAQEHKLSAGDSVHDPRTGRGCGEILAIDSDQGTVRLKRGPSLAGVAHPRSLIPSTPISASVIRDALRRVARWVIDNGVEAGGGYQAVRDLLLRRSPRLHGTGHGQALIQADEDPVVGCTRLALNLDQSLLAVQGPPGSGKTYAAAEIAVALAGRGLRVGVAAFTHRAIGNLLGEIVAAARRTGQPIRVLQKCEEDQACVEPGIEHRSDKAAVIDAVLAGEADVVAGTAWLFSDPRLDGRLDVLIIDEAGQMSLANVVACGTAARNMILLGDPQQLVQPSQGIHPDGADVSALDHLLQRRDTIPDDRGVFLASTRRLHPDVCAFVSAAFYEGRLSAHPDCARQRVDAGSGPSGTGLCLDYVAHRANRTWSAEEVAEVRTLVDALKTGTWTDSQGVTAPLGLDDILVVAPYNAQVKRLLDGLPLGARVGTVDKFQGQEAAVTIYSMATSSADDVPRNLEFLFSRNRLNVAVSRARALSIVVCSPDLLLVRCRTPQQLRLVNALCRYAEMAAAQ